MLTGCSSKLRRHGRYVTSI